MADSLAWTDGQLHVGEVTVTSQTGVSIYDGSEKVRRAFNDFFYVDYFFYHRQIIKKV